MTPKNVIRFTNDMVIVFDRLGQQVTALQGRYDNVREDVLNAATEDTVFEISRFGEWRRQVTRKEWADGTYCEDFRYPE